MKINHLTEEQIYEMVTLQNNLNVKTNGENWKSGVTKDGKVINWDTAILTEATELIDSFAWKWWKNIETPDDIENAKIEVTDIWHFMISKGLLKYDAKDLTVYISEFANADLVFTKLDYIDNVKEFMLSILRETVFGEYHLIDFYRLVYLIPNFTMKDVYKLYIAKNTLNKFRQDNGYATGTYIKSWLKDDVHVEDNVVMSDIIETLDIDGDFANKLYSELDKVYTNVKTNK